MSWFSRTIRDHDMEIIILTTTEVSGVEVVPLAQVKQLVDTLQQLYKMRNVTFAQNKSLTTEAGNVNDA